MPARNNSIMDAEQHSCKREESERTMLIQSSKISVTQFNETGGVHGHPGWLRKVGNAHFEPKSWSNSVTQRK